MEDTQNIEDPRILMFQAISLREKLNRTAAALNRDDFDSAVVVDPISLETPEFSSSELGLLRAVSWFYVLIHEAGKVGVMFLVERLDTYPVDPEGEKIVFHDVVRRLRTYFQHNLTPQKPRDFETIKTCESWFGSQCGSKTPTTEIQWRECLIGFLQEACAFLDALYQCVLHVEQDESKVQILKEWHTRRQRYHPPHEFDRLIEQVAGDMGREALDAKTFRQRFYDKWVKELELLSIPYDFQREARKRIEHALLHEVTPILPVDGRDVMHHFEIPPGPLVGALLKRANTLYTTQPCTSEELLQKLDGDDEVEKMLSKKE